MEVYIYMEAKSTHEPLQGLIVFELLTFVALYCNLQKL